MKTAGMVFALMFVAGVCDVGAHVTVQPREIPVKSFQEFLVRVPTEKDQPTTAVRIVFPEGFELLRVKPAAGWKYEMERDASGRVSSITWSGGRIGRTEYEVFSFMARAANPGTVKLEAYQTYGENDVVAWVNAAEPRPAPQIKVIAAAAPAQAAADPFAAGATAGPNTSTPVRDPVSTPSNTGVWLGGVSLVVSLMALVMSRRSSRAART
jgi:YD repeat-containing protein